MDSPIHHPEEHSGSKKCDDCGECRCGRTRDSETSNVIGTVGGMPPNRHAPVAPTHEPASQP